MDSDDIPPTPSPVFLLGTRTQCLEYSSHSETSMMESTLRQAEEEHTVSKHTVSKHTVSMGPRDISETLS